jgi:hypothetical protein
VGDALTSDVNEKYQTEEVLVKDGLQAVGPAVGVEIRVVAEG